MRRMVSVRAEAGRVGRPTAQRTRSLRLRARADAAVRAILEASGCAATPENISAARLHLREATKLFRATGREYAQALPPKALDAIRAFVKECEISEDSESL